MHYALLIVETPASEKTLESQIFFDTLRALSNLAKVYTNIQFLTGNVLQIPIDNQLEALCGVMAILNSEDAPGYKYTVLDEEIQLHARGTK